MAVLTMIAANMVGQIDELQQQVAELLYTTTESATARNSFKGDFGVSQELFEFLFDVCENDLPGSDGENVFTPHRDGTRSRSRPLGISPRNILAVALRRICLGMTFEAISEGIGKSDFWARRIFEETVRRLSNKESGFAKRFLCPQNPVQLWEWTKVNHPEVVEFVRSRLGDAFDEDLVYYVIAFDGVHFEGQRVADFLLHLVSRSEKKNNNTLLSIVAANHTMWASFLSDPVFGHTSELAAVEMTQVFERMYQFAMGNGADHVVVIADKGFPVLQRKSKEVASCTVVMPIRQKGGKQLGEDESAFVREIASIRQFIEYFFGRTKSLCASVARGGIKIGAKRSALPAHVEVLVALINVCIGITNAFYAHQAVEKGDNLWPSVVENISSLCLSARGWEDVPRPVPTPQNQLGSAFRRRLGDLPQLYPDRVESYFEGQFRHSPDEEHQYGRQATNLLAKGARLVVGHQFLGLRFRTINATNILVVFVCLSSFWRGVYHLAMEFIIATGKIVNHYCTCFVGKGQCIHQAGAVCLCMRYRRVDVADFRGKEGLGILKSSQVEPLSLKSLIDHCSALEASKMMAAAPVVVAVHPEPLDHANFVELKADVKKIRDYKMFLKYKRGQKSIGDELEERKVGELLQMGEDLGVDWKEEDEKAEGSLTKIQRSRIICRAIVKDGSDTEQTDRATYQLEVLDKCPCGEPDGEEQMIKCIKCRQWWHIGCSQHEGDVKHFMECPDCKHYKQELKEARDAGELGFFDNDLDDHFKK